MKNDGKGYESFVQNLQQALLNSEKVGGQENIKVERNVKLDDNSGITREFDLYWEYELAGVTYKTIIECKDYGSKVSVEKIDALLGKIADFPHLRPVFATRTGYQSGAQKKAEANGVELLIVREQNDSDWQDEDGNPIIKQIRINMKLLPAANITAFSPEIDGDWVVENTDIDVTKPLNLIGRNDEVIIEDLGRNDKYSLLQLEERLGHSDDGKFGELTVQEKFADAFICYGKTKYKMLSYTAVYKKSHPQNIPMNIDYFKELVGVIEYLQKGSKTAIFNHKIVKDW